MTLPQPIEDLLAVVPPSQRGALRALVRPVAGGSPAARASAGRFRRGSVPAPGITDSYVGGHPFLPPGMGWPTDERGGPMHFVVQVNFAQVPALPGFPRAGMLQMFVRADDTWGLTFDETGGLAGVHCRWFDPEDLSLPVAVEPTSAFPRPKDSVTPVEDPATPRLLQFERSEMLPQGGWDHSEADIATNPEGFAALEAAWEEHEDVADAALEGWDVQVGGWPSFVQAAPEPPAGRAHQLLLGLGSSGLMMWGDVGTAHLFGDPAALAAGDLSGLWWEWAC